MRSRSRLSWIGSAAMVAAAALMVASAPRAAARGGGGGTPPVDTGKIHYGTAYNSTAPSATWVMNPDGSGKTLLYGLPEGGAASQGLHDGMRWFAMFRPTGSGTYPVSGQPRQELWICDETGARMTQLTSDPAVEAEVWLGKGPRLVWLADGNGPDARISYVGHRLTTAGGVTTYSDVGIHHVGVDWSAVLAGTAQPAAPTYLSNVPLQWSLHDRGWAQCPTEYAWSPDGTQVAYTAWDDSFSVPRVERRGAWAPTTPVIVAQDAAAPAWSPLGDRIAFFRPSTYSIMTASALDGSAVTTVRSGSSEDRPLFPRWSPNATHVVYLCVKTRYKGPVRITYELRRIAVGGTGDTSLTGALSPSEFWFTGDLTIWRP